MIYKKLLLILILSLLLLTFCGCVNGQNEKEALKILRITGIFPKNMYLKVRTSFHSIPTRFGCKGISLADGEFKPLKEYKTYYIHYSGDKLEAPLTWLWRSKCRWKYREIEIIVIDSNGLSQTELIDIYNNKGDVPLKDTIHIICEHCVNPNIDPPFYYAECRKFHNGKKLRSLFYNMEGITKDTIDLTVNIFFESDSVSICDERNRMIYEEKMKKKSNNKMSESG